MSSTKSTITSDKKKSSSSNESNQKSFICVLPNDLLQNIVELLDEQSLANFAATRSYFFKTYSSYEFWQDKILALGIDEQALSKVAESKTLTNYAPLFHAIDCYTRFSGDYAHHFPTLLQPWQLLCMSGRLLAIEHAAKNLKLDAKSADDDGDNALHYAALSGNPQAMEYAVKVRAVPLKFL